MANFIGQDGFIWWIGIVESIDDPLTLGRCKVRCFGYHPAKSTNLVPTEDLPWAVSIHPLNTPNLYGTPRLGDWVFGFFLDSLSAQEPAILGYLPAIPVEASEYFGTAPNMTRSFASISNKNDVLWEVNNSKITIANTGNITTTSSNGIYSIANTISLNADDTVSIYSKKIIGISSIGPLQLTTSNTLLLAGSSEIKFIDKKYSTTLTEIMDRLKALEDKDAMQDIEIAAAKTLPVANT